MAHVLDEIKDENWSDRTLAWRATVNAVSHDGPVNG